MSTISTAKELPRYPGVEWRVRFFGVAVVAAFGVLLWQFWQLQVVNMSVFERMAEENTVRESPLESDRGVIYGMNDVVLADNRPSSDIVFVPGDCPKEQRESVALALERVLGISSKALLESVERFRRAPFTQIPVKTDVPKAERIRVEELSYELPGVLSVVRPQRRYLHGKSTGQILGYINEISAGELETWAGYKMGDLVGRLGIESQYESLLKGTDGYMLVTKYAEGLPQLRTNRFGVPYVAPRDTLGHILEQSDRRDPMSGNPVYLTLDVDLQAKCEEILRGEIGSIVVLDADTGAVRALVSLPNFDSTVFISGRTEEKAELQNDNQHKPMLSKAFRENYPPGSVFKIIMAAAALEEGVLTRDTRKYCPGFMSPPGVERKWHCWKRHGHGSVNVVEALAFSCDVFFYNVGLELGVDRMAAWCNKIGLGVKTGIDLPLENPGIIPDREFKRRVNKDRPVWDQEWRAGDTMNFSIGQGDANTTPLQNAVMMAAIVNDGYRVRPHLNQDLGPQLSERIISQSSIDIIKEGMRLCVDKDPPAPTGTGNAAKIPGVAILGKTGSAQVMSLEHHEQYKDEKDIPYESRDHAWFVAGVLDRAPRIAICILVEHGHHGSSAAAPLAKEVIKYFYERGQEDPMMMASGGTP